MFDGWAFAGGHGPPRVPLMQGNAILVVLSPHQNNFEMGLTVEQWSSTPPDDLGTWEEGFEASLEVGDLGLVYMSPVDTYVELDVPPGSYRARVVGRGFVNRGWPGSVTPGDVWRIQVRPCAEHIAPRRIARWETQGGWAAASSALADEGLVLSSAPVSETPLRRYQASPPGSRVTEP